MDNGRVQLIRANSELGSLEHHLAFQREVSHVSNVTVRIRSRQKNRNSSGPLAWEGGHKPEYTCLGSGRRSNLRITAVIPVYNEEEVIDEFSSRLVSALEKIDPDYEAIFIVEGTDATLEKLTALSKENPRIKVHYGQERLGLGKAMKKGFGLIDDDTEYVVTMDADLNHQPEEIQNLLAATKSADIVVGSRNTNKGMVEELPLVKRMISATSNWTMRKIFHIPRRDIVRGYVEDLSHGPVGSGAYHSLNEWKFFDHSLVRVPASDDNVCVVGGRHQVLYFFRLVV